MKFDFRSPNILHILLFCSRILHTGATQFQDIQLLDTKPFGKVEISSQYYRKEIFFNNKYDICFFDNSEICF